MADTVEEKLAAKGLSLPQDAQEAIAAGFEFVGRRPVP